MQLDQLIKEVESDRATINSSIEGMGQKVALQNKQIQKLKQELIDTEVLLERLKKLERD